MTAKKTAQRRRPMPVKVKMIQSVDEVPGKDTTVFFTDGTHAKVKTGSKLAKMLHDPEAVAPHLIQVTLSRGTITSAEKVDMPPKGG